MKIKGLVLGMALVGCGSEAPMMDSARDATLTQDASMDRNGGYHQDAGPGDLEGHVDALAVVDGGQTDLGLPDAAQGSLDAGNPDSGGWPKWVVTGTSTMTLRVGSCVLHGEVWSSQCDPGEAWRAHPIRVPSSSEGDVGAVLMDEGGVRQGARATVVGDTIAWVGGTLCSDEHDVTVRVVTWECR